MFIVTSSLKTYKHKQTFEEVKPVFWMFQQVAFLQIQSGWRFPPPLWWILARQWDWWEWAAGAWYLWRSMVGIDLGLVPERRLQGWQYSFHVAGNLQAARGSRDTSLAWICFVFLSWWAPPEPFARGRSRDIWHQVHSEVRGALQALNRDGSNRKAPRTTVFVHVSSDKTRNRCVLDSFFDPLPSVHGWNT